MDVMQLTMDGLKAAYPGFDVYGESVPQSFTEPCFRVKLVTAGVQRYPSGRRRETTSLDVQYYPAGNRKEQECRKVAETLMDALEFLPGYEARAAEMDWEVTDGVLHFFVSYRPFTMRVTQVAHMEEMEAASRLKEG